MTIEETLGSITTSLLSLSHIVTVSMQHGIDNHSTRRTRRHHDVTDLSRVFGAALG